jgi:regulator of RNase E activity RraA
MALPDQRKTLELGSLEPKTLATLRECSTATLTTQLLRRGYRQVFLVGVKPLNPTGTAFAAEAYTMRMIPAREDIDTFQSFGENDLQWSTVENMPAGTALVIDAHQRVEAGAYGSILFARLAARKVAAVVTDGAFRDGPAIAASNFPAYATTTTASSRTSLFHVADVQVPIGCAGVAVYPGDILVGDAEGVVVIPRHLADEVATEGLKQEELEAYLLDRIEAGEPLRGIYPPSEETLAAYSAKSSPSAG